MTVRATSVRSVPRGALPTRLVVLHSTHPPARWNARLACRTSAVVALAGGLLGILAALLLVETAGPEQMITYAAIGYAAGTVAGALVGLALGAAAGAAISTAEHLRGRQRVRTPQPLWVRHRST